MPVPIVPAMNAIDPATRAWPKRSRCGHRRWIVRASMSGVSPAAPTESIRTATASHGHPGRHGETHGGQRRPDRRHQVRDAHVAQPVGDEAPRRRGEDGDDRGNRGQHADEGDVDAHRLEVHDRVRRPRPDGHELEPVHDPRGHDRLRPGGGRAAACGLAAAAGGSIGGVGDGRLGVGGLGVRQSNLASAATSRKRSIWRCSQTSSLMSSILPTSAGCVLTRRSWTSDATV